MGIVLGSMLIFVLALVLVLWLVLAFVLAFVSALVLALELVLVASASIWHLAASGLAASNPSSGGWKSSPWPEIKPWRPEIEKKHHFL